MGISSVVGKTLATWDDKLRICESLNDDRNLIEAKWNQGDEASRIAEEVTAIGEYEAIKPYS